MKDFDAMVLSVVRARARAGAAPRRPIRLIFTADEEAGSGLGAHWLSTSTRSRRGLHRGDRRGRRLLADRRRRPPALSDPDRREGAGLAQPDRRRARPVTARSATTTTPSPNWPRRWPGSGRTSGRTGSPPRSEPSWTRCRRRSASSSTPIGRGDPGPARQHRPDGRRDHVQHGEPDDAVGRLQAQRHSRPGDRRDRRSVRARAARTSSTPRSPTCSATRCATRSSPAQPAVETEFSGALVEAMQSCLVAEDPEARAVPYLMSGGTDAKAWDRLGIRCFGFAPLRLPPDLDFVGHVPWRGRAGADRVAGVRRPGARSVPRSGVTRRFRFATPAVQI